MGTPRSSRRSAAPALLALALCGGCHLAPAKVWNLEQLHEPDGTARRRGELKGDITYLITELFKDSNFGGEPAEDGREAPPKEKRIKNPQGECLENLVELGACERDEKVAGLQAAAFGWLAVDCAHLLSRERAALELGGLAHALELHSAPPPPEGEPISPEAVKTAFDGLVAVVREVLAEPAMAGGALEKSCDGIRALSLDRQGALRLLRATNALLSGGERGAVLAPLRSLRLELSRRVVRLALRAALQDPHGRVRAAALEAGLRAFPDERAQLLRWALVEPMEGLEAREEVSLRALTQLARYGTPPMPAGEDPEVFTRFWEDLLVQILRLQVDGPHAVATCKALARITGEPVTLRPEVWLARAREAKLEEAEIEKEKAAEDPAAEPAADPAGDSGETP